MRRVLIVSPHFPPANAADHQRVRMALPYLREFGWDPTILGVEPRDLEGVPLDPLLLETVPFDVDVIRVRALPVRATRAFKIGNLALRALPALWITGGRLLKRERFDLVFFSTTQFPVMSLGPIWKRRFGVPYAVDFQDPWLDDYYRRIGSAPPGGKAKHGLSMRLASMLEPRVMADVAHVISVSPAYVATFRSRYPHLDPAAFTVLPFGAAERDFDVLDRSNVNQEVIDNTDGLLHFVYAGRGGADLAPALRLLFRALNLARTRFPERWGRVRLHFVGTSYAPQGQGERTVKPIANEMGAGDIVHEQTDRLGYFEALQVLNGADGLLIIGSDSPSYTPSKIYPYVLTRRPMLALLHADSPATDVIRRCRTGPMVTFRNTSDGAHEIEAAAQALETLLSAVERGDKPDVDWNEFDRHTARAMTRKMCEVFDQAARSQSEIPQGANAIVNFHA